MSAMLRSGEGGGAGYRRAFAVAAVVGSVGVALYLGVKKLRANKAKGVTRTDTAAEDKLKGGKKTVDEVKSQTEVEKTDQVKEVPNEVKSSEDPSEKRSSSSVNDEVKVDEPIKQSDPHTTTPPILSPSVPSDQPQEPSTDTDVPKLEEAVEGKGAEPFVQSKKETEKEDVSPAQTVANGQFETKMDNDVVVVQESVRKPDIDPSESILSLDSSITTLDDESLEAADIPSIEITSETPPHEQPPSRTALSSLGDDIEIITDGGSIELDRSIDLSSGDFVKVKHSEEEEDVEEPAEGTGKGEKVGTGKGEAEGTGKGEKVGTGKGEKEGTGKGEKVGTGKGETVGTGKGEKVGTGKGEKVESKDGDGKDITKESTSSKEKEDQAAFSVHNEDEQLKEGVASDDQADVSIGSSPGRPINEPSGTE